MKPSRSRVFALAAVLALAFAAAPAGASFHLMQIDQVAGGFCGLPEAQAIQLRMRTAGQNLTTGAQLIALDDAGASPVTLITIPGNVANAAGGARILFATPAFVAAAGGPTPDFTLTNPIPASYLDAGKLTFGAAGIVYWALAWGGAGYTGVGTGSTDNDLNGQFNPPFGGPLPSTGNGQALRFTGAATALSTTNQADYALTTAGPGATFTNNAGESGTVPVPVPAVNSTWGRIKESYR